MVSSQTRMRMPALLLALLLMLVNATTALAYDSDKPEELSASDLEAASAILIDGHTGRVLFEKDPDTVRYPASTTKIMTLLLALENVDDLDSMITIPKEANQYPEGSSLVGLYTGEEMTWRTLLNVFFICSGNDAGIAIAVLIAGSEEAFADMMNERAQQIGCTSTHFTNPHGFHDPDHYTTARDLAMIALEAMKNEEFRTIAFTTNYTIPANNKRAEATTKWTKNQFIARNDTSMQYKYVYGTGIKTGYTSKAGQTFVGSATRDGVDLISVVLLSSTDGKWIDSIRLMEYGFATYKSYDPVALYNQSPLDVAVSDYASDDASGGLVRLDISSSYTDPICATPEELEEINAGFTSMLSTSFTRELKAPVNAGEVMGTLTYTAPSGDKYYFTMTAANSVAAAPVTDLPSLDELMQPEEAAGEATTSPFVWIVPLAAVIGVMLIMIAINNARTRRRRRSRRRRSYASYEQQYRNRR